MIKNIKISKKAIQIVVLTLIAILSITVFTKVSTSPNFYNSTIETLDDKKITVVELTAATAAASIAVSAIPGDATTPIANQIAQLSSYLLIVICAIFLEKILLTLSGYIMFSIIIPISCLFLIIYLYKRNDYLKKLVTKLITFGLIIVMIVPVSVQVSKIIDKTLNTQEMFETAKIEFNDLNEETNAGTGFLDKVSDKISLGVDKAKKILSDFVDAIAALIITACIIPIGMIFVLVWIIKMLFGINIKLPSQKKRQNKTIIQQTNPIE